VTRKDPQKKQDKSKKSRDPIGERAHELMKQHEEEADALLDEQWKQQIPGHVLYTVGVIGGAFLLNLLVLVVVTGG
jgi:hypothetical protein